MEQISVFHIRKMDQERLWLGLHLAMVPVDTLPSEKTVLRAFNGIFDNNMKKYQDNSEKIGCLLLKDTNNARCEVEKGCCKIPRLCLILYESYRTTDPFEADFGEFWDTLYLAKVCLEQKISYEI